MIRHYRTLPYVSKCEPGGFANVEIVLVERNQARTSDFTTRVHCCFKMTHINVRINLETEVP